MNIFGINFNVNISFRDLFAQRKMSNVAVISNLRYEHMLYAEISNIGSEDIMNFNTKIDYGDIIIQKKLLFSNKDNYYIVIDKIFKESYNCLLEAFNNIEDNSFVPKPMSMIKDNIYKFPTLKQALLNYFILRKRRNGK